MMVSSALVSYTITFLLFIVFAPPKLDQFGAEAFRRGASRIIAIEQNSLSQCVHNHPAIITVAQVALQLGAHGSVQFAVEIAGDLLFDFLARNGRDP